MVPDDIKNRIREFKEKNNIPMGANILAYLRCIENGDWSLDILFSLLEAHCELKNKYDNLKYKIKDLHNGLDKGL
jgi:hypothetical protein